MGQNAEPVIEPETEPKKSKEKSKIHLIFQAPETAPQADLPKFYKKPGRQRNEEQVRSIILYRLARRNWPYGISDYMKWYYETKYIDVKGEYHGKVKEWRKAGRESPARSSPIYQLA